MKELKITKEKVLEASEKCGQAREVLKALFPEAFEEEQKIITSKVELRLEAVGSGYHFIKLSYKGDDIGIMRQGHLIEYRSTKYPIEYENDTVRISVVNES